MIRITKLNMYSDGLRKLERELDRIADKHNIEEPMRFMPSSDLLGREDDEDDDEF